MGTLNIAITGAQRLPLRVTADGAPLGMTRNRHGNLTYSLQTQAQRVKLCIETVHELRSPLWFFASLFFFLISVFGIFDVRRPYDRKGRTMRAVFWVDMGGAPEKSVHFAALPFREGAQSFGADGTGIAQEENVAATDAVLRRRARAMTAVKIMLWAVLIIGIVAGVLTSLP